MRKPSFDFITDFEIWILNFLELTANTSFDTLYNMAWLLIFVGGTIILKLVLYSQILIDYINLVFSENAWINGSYHDFRFAGFSCLIWIIKTILIWIFKSKSINSLLILSIKHPVFKAISIAQVLGD